MDVSAMIDEDWILLADKLGVSSADINAITLECPDRVSEQAFSMLELWNRQAGNKNSRKYRGHFFFCVISPFGVVKRVCFSILVNILENALLSIGRQDIVQECILNAHESKRRKNGNEVYSNGIANDILEDYRTGKKDHAASE